MSVEVLRNEMGLYFLPVPIPVHEFEHKCFSNVCIAIHLGYAR
jgi:hypothetical protein